VGREVRPNFSNSKNEFRLEMTLYFRLPDPVKSVRLGGGSGVSSSSSKVGGSNAIHSVTVMRHLGDTIACNYGNQLRKERKTTAQLTMEKIFNVLTGFEPALSTVYYSLSFSQDLFAMTFHSFISPWVFACMSTVSTHSPARRLVHFPLLSDKKD
jgi:hypothetical protein